MSKGLSRLKSISFRRHFWKVCHSYQGKRVLVQAPTERRKNRRIRFLVPGHVSLDARMSLLP